MSYTKTTKKKEIEAIAKKVGTGYETVRRRVKIYEHKKDWHLKASNSNYIKLKKGVDNNGLIIITGHPINSGGYYSYRVTCKYCGNNHQTGINRIIGSNPRICCGRNTTKADNGPVVLGKAYQPSAAKRIKFSALLVRYYDVTIDGCLCNSCSRVNHCSDMFYECQCNRVDDDRELKTQGNCALARASVMMSGVPNEMSSKRNDLGIPADKLDRLCPPLPG